MEKPGPIPLNPCDYLYFTHHELQLKRAQPGNIAFMVFDVAGEIDAEKLVRGLAGVFRLHPSLLAGLKISLTKGRPYWRSRVVDMAAAEAAARKAYRRADLRNDRDAPDAFLRLVEAHMGEAWPLSTGPKMLLDQALMPGGTSRFAILWPHLFTDAEGAQWFLTQLSRQLAENSPDQADDYPTGLTHDQPPIDVLDGYGFSHRISLFRRGFGLQKQHEGMEIKQALDSPMKPGNTCRLIHREWGGDELLRIQQNAKQMTPPGPALYARFLSACVFRALHRIYKHERVETEAYLMPLPLSVLAMSDEGDEQRSRPLPGNYLVSPVLCATSAIVEDRSALAADLSRQLIEYRRSRAHLMQWAMVWMAAKMRSGVYRWVLKRPLGFEKLASGFSYYGEISDPLRLMGGFKVTNLWGSGPMPVPPGWNPVFSRFADKLNLGLTYCRPAVSDDLARRYASAIEEEILSS
jgi:hypothetical protein